jgi:hypothetical protein
MKRTSSYTIGIQPAFGTRGKTKEISYVQISITNIAETLRQIVSDATVYRYYIPCYIPGQFLLSTHVHIQARLSWTPFSDTPLLMATNKIFGSY